MIKKIFTVSVVVMTIFWAVGLAAFVPTAQAATISSGDLIKASLPAVYYYGADGKRYVFPNEPTYFTWYPDFSGVKTITDGELAAIPIGGNVTFRPGVMLAKITTDPKVYAIAANGTLRWITTASIAACLYGANWGTMIKDVSDAFFVNYTVGAPINDCADYDRAAATAAAQSINVDKGLAGTTIGGGNLNVALASDTPASATVSDGASADFTKITLTVGSTATTVNSMYITRSGLTSNDDITNVKLVDASGTTVGSIASFGANSKALVTFVPALQMAANTTLTLYIRASIVAPTVSGKTAALGIAAATDVILAAGTVTGAFPITGNYMTVVNLSASLGVLTVDKLSALGVNDSNPSAGAKRVLAAEYKISAGANEDLTVQNIGLMESGSASNQDYANIELYSVTESRTLGTVAAWNANSAASFGNLNLTIPRGANHLFQVYFDVVSGSGSVLDVDITDGSDILVTAKGNTYGFYITPTPGTNLGDGQGISNLLPTALERGQTVKAGSLTVARSITSPSVGNITQASEQKITTWDFNVLGESVKINSTLVTMTFGGGLAFSDLQNAKIVDETGLLIAGPKTITGNTVTFTDTYIVPTGTHKYTFIVDVLSTAPTGGTIIAGIANPGANLSVSGMTTRDTIVATPATAVDGNKQTILGVALSVANLTAPAARTVAAGTQNYVWATAALDATNSGEDVRVSGVTVTDTFVNGHVVAPAAVIANAISAEVAAPFTSVVTVAGHGLVSGDTITITGSNSIPAINGTFIVTVLTVNTFSITVPAKITVAGTLGAYTGLGTSTKLANSNDLTNMQIWADLTSASSARGDVYETQISDTITPVNSTASPVAQGISLTQVITVAKGTFVKIAVVANLSALADPLDTHTLSITAVNASGQATGNTITPAPTGAGQAMTISGAGTLTATLDASSPVKQILVSGQQKITVGVIKLAATNVEAQDLDSVLINDLGAGDVSGNWYLYASARADGGSVADPIAIAPGDTSANFQLADGTVTIPANGNVILTVKTDVALVDGTTVTNGSLLTANAAIGAIQTTGLSSGAVINNTVAVTAAAHVAMASRPYFSLANTSPSGALITGLAVPLATFSVRADAADDITWDGTALPNGAGANVMLMRVSDACVTSMTLQNAGTTLSTVAPAAGLATFIFEGSDLTVGAGQTVQLNVIGTTSTCTSPKSVQVYFDAGDVQSWSINRDGGAYDISDVIFRGNLYANALSN